MSMIDLIPRIEGRGGHAREEWRKDEGSGGGSWGPTYRQLLVFLNFCKHQIPDIKKRLPTAKFGAIGRDLRVRWCDLSLTQKEEFSAPSPKVAATSSSNGAQRFQCNSDVGVGYRRTAHRADRLSSPRGPDLGQVLSIVSSARMQLSKTKKTPILPFFFSSAAPQSTTPKTETTPTLS